MKFLKNKTIMVIAAVLVILIVFASTYISINFTKPSTDVATQPEPIKQAKYIIIDFNGDGIGETLNVFEIEKNRVQMEVFNAKGEKIADLWNGIPLYPTTLYDVISLSAKSKKQCLQWNMAIGPHQTETVFLTIVGDKVYPILSFDFEKYTMYSPFYNSRGGIVVGDMNNDGLSEIIENVDEYPTDSPRLNDPEIVKKVRDEFSKSGFPEEIIQKNIDIITRENYGKGRGRKVILAIHSFVDAETPLFRRLPTKEYEEIAGRLVTASIEIAKSPDDATGGWEQERFLRYSDLTQDSEDFNDFVRDFWTHGRPFETKIPVD